MNFFFSSRRRHTFFFQAEDGIRDRSPSRGLGDVYKRQLEKGYKIRFESAVETQKYHTKDTEIALSSAALNNREGVKGNGYIRNVRFIKVQ